MTDLPKDERVLFSVRLIVHKRDKFLDPPANEEMLSEENLTVADIEHELCLPDFFETLTNDFIDQIEADEEYRLHQPEPLEDREDR